MHPDFAHQRKRFSLSLVVTCLGLMLGPCRSIRSISKRFGVSRHTLRRWIDGFTKQNILSKRLCVRQIKISNGIA
jgi:transposase-like protein